MIAFIKLTDYGNDAKLLVNVSPIEGVYQNDDRTDIIMSSGARVVVVESRDAIEALLNETMLGVLDP